MDRKTYIATVLSALRHVTGDEQLAIRAELDGHIEDHMEGLLELGYDPELAEERTLSAMGDPKEVGRALDRQYPYRWLIVKWAAQGLTVLLVLVLLSGWWDVLGNLACYARARLWPATIANVEWLARQSGRELELVQDMDREFRLGTATCRVWQIGLEHPSEQAMAEKGGMTYVAVSCWEDEPWAEPQGLVEVYSTAGVKSTRSMGGSWGMAWEIPVTFGDTLRVCWYDELAHQYETLLTVELPWEESP